MTWNKVLRVPPNFFQSLYSSDFGFTLIRVIIGSKKFAPLRLFQPITTRRHFPTLGTSYMALHPVLIDRSEQTNSDLFALISRASGAGMSVIFLNSDWFTK